MSDSRSQVVDLCSSADLITGPVKDWGIDPLPGRLLLQMVKPETRGMVVLPDRVQHCCDVGRIVAGTLPGAQAGDHVVVRPYAGMWLTLDRPLDGRLLGAADPAWHSVAARWDGEQLVPLGPWLVAEPASSRVLLPGSSGWLKALAWGPDCPDWLGQVDSFSSALFPDRLALAPGFGQDGRLLICTRS